MNIEEAKNILEEAHLAGARALEACRPEPMIATDGRQSWRIADGACGFAWVTVECKGRGMQLVNAMKKMGIASADINCFDCRVEWKKAVYGKGYVYWVHAGNQSVELKEAYANAMAGVLREHNIPCMSQSRLD